MSVLVVGQKTVAVRWDGTPAALECARQMVQPQFNVARISDPLQGDCLVAMAGAMTWAVPLGSWLVQEKRGALPSVSTDDMMAHSLRRLVA